MFIRVLPFIAAGFVACASAPRPEIESAPRGPVDARATPETRALFENLRRTARESRVLFGHQDDLAYGYRWFAEPGRSDVKEAAGAYPAVYGWDIAGLERGSPVNIDSVSFDRMRAWIGESYGRGGVTTISWHVDNPVSRGNAWDTTRAVATLLPGGANHGWYTERLDRVADFVLRLRARGRSGREALVPVVFRPFHEMTGGWFWWGAGHATPDEYRALWRFTVEYLRDTRGVHNLLYAYAPNVAGATGTDTYLDFYPGDAYVDVLGYDEYFGRGGDGAAARAALAAHLRWVVGEAESRSKVPALTETGLETIPDSTWWTGSLLAALQSDPAAGRIAWVLVWRNAARAVVKRDHFYAPYPGQASAADFVRFRQSPNILFEDELPDMYTLPSAGRR